MAPSPTKTTRGTARKSAAGTATGRFARPTPAATRRAAPAKRPGVSRTGFPSSIRRKPQPKSKGLAGTLTALLPIGAGKSKSKGKSGPGKGKSGGLAMLAAGAGLAFKNRDKLQGLLNRKRGDHDEQPAVTDAAPIAPVAPGTSPGAGGL
jgi:hypothetical protein